MTRFFYLIFFVIISFNLCFSQVSKVSLLFAGDAMQHMPQVNAANTKDGYDYSGCFMLIQDQIQQADVAVVNLETTLPGRGYSGYPMFGSPDAFAYALKDAGFDVFLTANNHSQDKGKKGVERTIAVLDSMQVKHLGSYIDMDKRALLYPLMMVKNGIRIAMLNYTYDLNGLKAQHPNIINLIDEKQIYDDIQMAKQLNPDIIIANMHWGEEYWLKPSKRQRELADFLIENGVRLVIGSHPHVVQPIDIQQDRDSIKNIVVYSLGNFISNQSKPNTDGGMMVNIEISKNEKGNINIDSCNYSLVWVYKHTEDNKVKYELLPIEKYNNENGLQKLGEIAYKKMTSFARNAKKTIESMWPKPEETTNKIATAAQ